MGKLLPKPRGQPIVGQRDDVLAWIQHSTLAAEYKMGLTDFVRRFPTLEFYRETESILGSIEARHQVVFPELLREIRKTLAFVELNNRPAIGLDAFDGWSPRGDDISEMRYRFDLIGYANVEQSELLKQANLFPVGESEEAGVSTLAVDLTPEAGLRLFEYCEEDLWDNLADGFPVFDSARVVFDSYIDMFGHIVSIKLDNGQIISAKFL